MTKSALFSGQRDSDTSGEQIVKTKIGTVGFTNQYQQHMPTHSFYGSIQRGEDIAAQQDWVSQTSANLSHPSTESSDPQSQIEALAGSKQFLMPDLEDTVKSQPQTFKAESGLVKNLTYEGREISSSEIFAADREEDTNTSLLGGEKAPLEIKSSSGAANFVLNPVIASLGMTGSVSAAASQQEQVENTVNTSTPTSSLEPAAHTTSVSASIPEVTSPTGVGMGSSSVTTVTGTDNVEGHSIAIEVQPAAEVAPPTVTTPVTAVVTGVDVVTSPGQATVVVPSAESATPIIATTPDGVIAEAVPAGVIEATVASHSPINSDNSVTATENLATGVVLGDASSTTTAVRVEAATTVSSATADASTETARVNAISATTSEHVAVATPTSDDSHAGSVGIATDSSVAQTAHPAVSDGLAASDVGHVTLGESDAVTPVAVDSTVTANETVSSTLTSTVTHTAVEEAVPSSGAHVTVIAEPTADSFSNGHVAGSTESIEVREGSVAVQHSGGEKAHAAVDTAANSDVKVEAVSDLKATISLAGDHVLPGMHDSTDAHATAAKAGVVSTDVLAASREGLASVDVISADRLAKADPVAAAKSVEDYRAAPTSKEAAAVVKQDPAAMEKAHGDMSAKVAHAEKLSADIAHNTGSDLTKTASSDLTHLKGADSLSGHNDLFTFSNEGHDGLYATNSANSASWVNTTHAASDYALASTSLKSAQSDWLSHTKSDTSALVGKAEGGKGGADHAINDAGHGHVAPAHTTMHDLDQIISGS